MFKMSIFAPIERGFVLSRQLQNFSILTILVRYAMICEDVNETQIYADLAESVIVRQ